MSKFFAEFSNKFSMTGLICEHDSKDIRKLIKDLSIQNSFLTSLSSTFIPSPSIFNVTSGLVLMQWVIGVLLVPPSGMNYKQK